MRIRHDLVPHQLHRQIDRFFATLVEIDVRVLVAVQQDVSLYQHRLRQVPVQIERHHQGHLGADKLAHLGQQSAFDVVTALCRSRTVQRKADRINRTSRHEAAQHLLLQRLERCETDCGRGLRRRRKGRHDLNAKPRAAGQHSSEAVPHPRVTLPDLLAMLPLQRLERVDLREARPKRVRLVHHFSDSDSHQLPLVMDVLSLSSGVAACLRTGKLPQAVTTLVATNLITKGVRRTISAFLGICGCLLTTTLHGFT